MSDGLSDKDLRKLATFILEGKQNEASTARQVQNSVVDSLRKSGEIALGGKLANTSPEAWSSFWSGIKELFSVIWDNVAGAAEKLIDFLLGIFD